jgi:hypothetical protein
MTGILGPTSGLWNNGLMGWEQGRMHYLRLVVLVGIVMAGAITAADKVADLSGTWILDPEHSQIERLPPATGELNLNISGPFAIEESGDPPREILPDVPSASWVANLILRIVQTGDKIQTVRQFKVGGKEQSFAQEFLLNGSQSINLASDGRGEFVSRSTWEKEKLIHSGIQTITRGAQRAQVYVKEEYSISKNGKKLTIKTMSTMPQGIVKLKQVFIRETVNGIPKGRL